MQLINRKNFISIVCTVYTIISLSKIILEAMQGYKDPYYVENFITIFFISLGATFVLGLHYYLQNVPLTIVILGQYIFLLGIIMLSIWIESHFQKMASTAYRDMFLSFTFPYIIGAIIYYVSIMLQMRKANKTLEEINKGGGKKDEY
ncbi:DUF6608 family protein [Anaeromicropila herbilytica]|uniref:DUF3021 domain-containing protein n=1 Tax=Anaeromicropila herbilytica TaxID=2785025 RepID=A0A7R7IC57_9FIRM|nr:DUF6608 family protein [Anaeromicropila herbilytica]BCN30378.1 hypothetical protein bsdtb5_16730 [Anaeromicropila herbilytica]